jgi:cytochrome P450
METLLGNGIFNVDGDDWRHQRKTASFEFASRILRDYSTVVFRENALKVADILAKVSQTHQPIDMQVGTLRRQVDVVRLWGSP